MDVDTFDDFDTFESYFSDVLWYIVARILIEDNGSVASVIKDIDNNVNDNDNLELFSSETIKQKFAYYRNNYLTLLIVIGSLYLNFAYFSASDLEFYRNQKKTYRKLDSGILSFTPNIDVYYIYDFLHNSDFVQKQKQLKKIPDNAKLILRDGCPDHSEFLSLCIEKLENIDNVKKHLSNDQKIGRVKTSTMLMYHLFLEVIKKFSNFNDIILSKSQHNKPNIQQDNTIQIIELEDSSFLSNLDQSVISSLGQEKTFIDPIDIPQPQQPSQSQQQKNPENQNISLQTQNQDIIFTISPPSPTMSSTLTFISEHKIDPHEGTFNFPFFFSKKKQKEI